MSTIKFIGLLILTTFLMGSSFTITKIGLAYASPLFLAALRFISAGIIMAIATRLFKVPYPTTRSAWIKICIIGSCQTAGFMGGVFLSLLTITASESSILATTSPLFVVILGTLFLKNHYKYYQWIGVLLGIVGVMVTLGAQIKIEIGLIFGLFAAFFWAVSTSMVSRWGAELNTWVLTAYQMLFGGFLLLLASLTLEQPFFIVTIASIALLSWLSIISSVALAIWFYLLQKSDPGKASSFLFLVPFFGILTGWVLLNEDLYPSLLLSGLLIIISIYLVNRKGK